LQFNDQQVGDEQVDAQAAGETDPPAFEGDRLLPFDTQSPFRRSGQGPGGVFRLVVQGCG